MISDPDPWDQISRSVSGIHEHVCPSVTKPNRNINQLLFPSHLTEETRIVRAQLREICLKCDGVTFLHKSCGRPTRGTTTPPRQLPPGTPAAALLHRRTDADRPPIPKTSHSGPTRDHSVPVRYYLILIPSRQILPSHLARLPSSPPDTHRPPSPSARYIIISTANSQKMPQATLQRRRPDVARPPASNDGHRTGQHVTFHAFTR